MESLARSLCRLLIALGAGALVGIVTWLIAVATVVYAWPAPTFIAPAVVAGLAGGLGGELDGWFHLPVRRYLPAWLVVLAALCALVGALFGATPLAPFSQGDGTQGPPILLPPITFVALSAGLVSGHRGWPGAWLDSLGAFAVMAVNALAFILGAGLFFALTYAPPCLQNPVLRCALLGRWFIFQVFGPMAIAAGLWLGIVVWLAIAAGGALSPRTSGPVEPLPSASA
jgi:hypothetical protein